MKSLAAKPLLPSKAGFSDLAEFSLLEDRLILNLMIVTSEIDEVRSAVASQRLEGRRIGCVPTMGALHAGHLSLVDEARQRSDYVVVTIFVNPTQFGPNEDLADYPRPIENDLARCQMSRVDLVFTPQVPDLYPDGYETYVDVQRISKAFEGKSRPGHFRGVATIVLKLLHIVQPDVACFGQKDYQQQTLIRRMVRDLNIPCEIAVCPTIRELDGLAMSSRNAYLSARERESAACLYRSLVLAQELVDRGESEIRTIEDAMRREIESGEDVTLEYARIVDADTLQDLQTVSEPMVALVAARIGSTRLIDNDLIVYTT